MLLATVACAVCPADGATRMSRYLAAFADGRRVAGDNLHHWHTHPGSPHLQGTSLSDPKRPLVWLRDMTLNRWRADYYCVGYVEFVGGDRLIGRFEGGQEAAEIRGQHVPMHVLVKPVEKLLPPTVGSSSRRSAVYRPRQYVRILPDRIQRIVVGQPSKRRLNPGNLYLANGRRVSFKSVRWRKDSVMLLLDKGTREVKLSEIAEIHMPRVDPWEAYYRELAAVSPMLKARLIRFETTGGLIATASEARLAARPFKTSEEEWNAFARRRHYVQQIEQVRLRLAQIGKAVDLARKNYAAKEAELRKIQAADRQAYDKALAALRQRMAQQRKSDEARLAGEHRKLAEQLRTAEQAMRKQLEKTPAKQRDNMLRQFRDRQANLKRSRETALAQERSKLQANRDRQITNFTSKEPQRIANSRKGLVGEVAKLKQKYDSQVASHRRHSAQISAISRQHAAVPTPQGTADTWTHIIQPAWSLDPLWVRFNSIRMRFSFAPDKIPLSRIPPEASVDPEMLPWRADRNVAGGPLCSGGRRYGWGFGVHAASRLSFVLPPQARSFHCRLGLDHFVDTGGCARARVYVGSTQLRPRYESPVMIGSKRTVETGWVSLNSPPDVPRRLILQVDPMARNHPANADPLNIRDKFDWLDPQIALDPGGLANEVRRRIAPQITAWRGWTVRLDKNSAYTWGSCYDETSEPGGRFAATVRPEAQPLVLSRQIAVGPSDKWLIVDAGYVGGGDIHAGSVTLHVGKTAIPEDKMPIRQLWMRRGPPLIFPIAKYGGKKVVFEIRRAAGGRPLYWRRIAVTNELPDSYNLAKVLKAFGKEDMKVRPGLAGILASNRVSKQVKQTVLEIHRLGGEVNYRGRVTLWFGLDPDRRLDGGDIVNALIGCDWKGGDNGLMLLKKLPGLQYAALANTAGVSKQAVNALKTAMPNVRLLACRRSPSASYSPRCSITVRNGSGREVALFYLDYWGNIREFARLKPRGQLTRTSGIGKRYEAHPAATKDPNKAKPISRFVANPGAIWDVRSP